MKEQIEVITYEQERLNYFTNLMNKAQKRYRRLFKKYKYAPILSDEYQQLGDAGRETQFFGDVVEMLEKGYRKQSEGEWEKRTFIIFDSEKVGYNCSECNTTWDTPTPFCPNCGAKMKGGEE